MYLHGRGVQRDPCLALEWYRQAAQHADRELLHNISQMVEAENDTFNAWSFAFSCYPNAAKAGNAESQAMVGMRYFQGNGVNEDHTIAVEYLESATSKGHPNTLAFLGRLCEHGDLGSPNLPHAAMLYYLAAVQGHPKAKDWGVDLLNRMPAEQQHDAAERINAAKARFATPSRAASESTL